MVEPEAPAGAHNNQPTDGSDSDRSGSGNGISHGNSSGDSGNGVAMAAAQTVAAATAAREIYIKKGQKRRSCE